MDHDQMGLLASVVGTWGLHETKKLSLEDFDDKNTEPPFLTSPR